LGVRCSGTKRDGSPCTATVEAPHRFCWWHDPANAEKRRRAASKAGKSKLSKELAGIKQRLSDLADAVLSDDEETRVDKGVAAVASQVLNVYLRAVSVELKAITRARDRRGALYQLYGGTFGIFPYDEDALIERGELVPRSVVVGRELGEPVEDYSE
jgi:hypothetical protein